MKSSPTEAGGTEKKNKERTAALTNQRFFCAHRQDQKERRRGSWPGKRYLTPFWMDLEQKAIERVRTASQMSFALYGSPLVVTRVQGTAGKQIPPAMGGDLLPFLLKS